MRANVLLVKFWLFSFVCSVHGNIPDLQTHDQTWTQITEGSWRIEELHPGIISVADFLIDSFGKYPELDRRNIKRFYRRHPSNLVVWHGANLPSSKLRAKDNARTWQRKLNFRELFRFKAILSQNTNLINNNNFESDDIVKARSLCGTFARKTTGGDYLPVFSGMLVPGQIYLEDQAADNGLYRVHTCLHGFFRQQINSLYFIPYGLPIADDFAFQVQSIYSDHNAHNPISQHQLDIYIRKTKTILTSVKTTA